MIDITNAGCGWLYANQISKKYSQKGFQGFNQLAATYDPYISDSAYSKTLNAENVPLFRDVEKWKQFTATRPAKNVPVVNVAVKPHATLDVIRDFYEQGGVSRFILQKPVAHTMAGLEKIKTLAQRHNLQLAVASNWGFSGFTSMLKETLKKAQAADYNVEKVVVRYGKMREQGIKDSNPALAELSHVLQILKSSELIDSGWENIKPTARYATYTENKASTLGITYAGVPGVRPGKPFDVDVDLVLKQPQAGDNPDERIRFVMVYFDDGDKKPDLIQVEGPGWEKIVDKFFVMKDPIQKISRNEPSNVTIDYSQLYDPKCEQRLKEGGIYYNIGETSPSRPTISSVSPKNPKGHIAFSEDTLVRMYGKVCDTFMQTAKELDPKAAWKRFQEKCDVTFEKFYPIARQVILAHELWMKEAQMEGYVEQPGNALKFRRADSKAYTDTQAATMGRIA
ncbi:MAG: hypothetical protein KTR14_08235 [Vampirovibrio sp.]|nr:hypothetical protein [Vampirovibrio sp.]